MENPISIRDRWLGALCYLSVLVFVPLLSTTKTDFLARHSRQGFALLFIEVVGVFFIWIVDVTLGRLPLLGFLLVIALRLVFFLFVLSMSVMGFTKAIFGETWRLPYLDELADRIPVHESPSQ
ncbi:MAG: hypothetical protein KAH56_07895 [Candidatus Krumholzibacteria bacterium]|nr:hypothetical protein [Candidatus Krumholzibacteria bacterium]